MASLTAFPDRIVVEKKGGFLEAALPSAVGIDVHAEILVCAHEWFDFEARECKHEFKEFGCSQSQRREFAEWVASKHAPVIIMESTGVLWRAPYEALEDAGVPQSTLLLVNARDVKGKRGHKTDRQDALNLARQARMGPIDGSFVPPRDFRNMRITSRAYIRSKQDLAREKNRYQKALNSYGSRAGSVFSDVHGKCASAIIDALVNDPDHFEAVVKSKAKRLRHSAEEIMDALVPIMDESMRRLLRMLRARVSETEKQCEALFDLLRDEQAPYQKQIDRLMTIPHMKEVSARLILAEIGPDLSAFTSVERFSAWAGVCPGVKESAKKAKKGVPVLQGNRWLRFALIELANGIALTRDGNFLHRIFQKFRERTNRGKAIFALAHKIIRIIYALFKNNEDYEECTDDGLEMARARRLARAAKQAALSHLAVADRAVYDTITGEIKAVA